MAWHTESDGYYECQSYVCFACSALAGRPTAGGARVINTRPDNAGPMPPFELGVTTAAYEPPRPPQR